MNGHDFPIGPVLPITVVRPFEPQTREVREIESSILEQIRVPVEFSINGSHAPKTVFVASTADVILDHLIGYYRREQIPEEIKERNIDILEHAARDLVNYAVVAQELPGRKSQFIVLRRGIEYVAGRDGTPLAIRMVHDVVASHCQGGFDTGPIMEACGAGVLSDLMKLHLDAASIAAQLLSHGQSYHALEPQLPFTTEPAVRVESHIKGNSDADEDAVHTLGALVETYSGHWDSVIGSIGEVGPAYIVGPFFPGTWFGGERPKNDRDSRDSLRTRQVLRSASLIARSDLRRITPLERPDFAFGRRAETIAAEYASTIAMVAGGFAFDASEKDPNAVFGDFGSDVRNGVIYVFDIMNRARSAYLGIERTLDVSLVGEVMAPLTLDIRVCHVLGRVDLPAIAGRIAEVLHDQAVSDIFSLQGSLTEFEGDIVVRFRGPKGVLKHVKQVIRRDWNQSLASFRHERSNHRVLAPELIEEDLRPDQDCESPAAVIFPRLDPAAEINPAAVYEAAEEAMGEPLDAVEVLRFVDGQIEWVEVDEVEEETEEPFWLLRAWGDGGPMPVVYSTVSERSISWDGWSPQELLANFRYTLTSFAKDKSPVPIRMGGVWKLQEAAQKLFSGTSILIAPIELVDLRSEDEDIIFGDDLIDQGEDALQHLIMCADPDRGYLLCEDEWVNRQNSAVLIAVHDDLRLNSTLKGADMVLARFLAYRALELVDSADECSDPIMFVMALAYVRKILDPGRTSLLSRSETRLMKEAMAFVYDSRMSEAKVLAAITAAIEEVVQGPSKARIYLAAARIAQAFEVVSDHAQLSGARMAS